MNAPSTDIPRALRWMMLGHAVLDGPFGLLLVVSPTLALSAAGVTPDPLFARIYGAALVGVAFVSVRVRDEGRAPYRVVLVHKIAWAGSAAIACTIAALGGAPTIAWVFGATFLAFTLVWSYWLVRLRDA